MSYFDTHCHLDFPEFDADRDSVWADCQARAIHRLVIPGVSPGQWQRAAASCARHEGIYQALGLHPWWFKEFAGEDALASDLRRIQEYPKAVAIGECGLDALVDIPMELQQAAFGVHIKLAAELRLPIIIHACKAHNEVIKLLRSADLQAGGVIHAFSGSAETARQYWEMGFLLGIGGTITYERARKTREAVRQVPLEALLLESDAPDMPLQGEQGRRNSPQNIPRIAQTLAELRQEPLELIARTTTANASKLFGIP